MEYVVIVHTAEEGGYWAEVPALDGCFAQGESVEDAIDDVRGAITSHLEAMVAFGGDSEVPREGRVLMTMVAV